MSMITPPSSQTYVEVKDEKQDYGDGIELLKREVAYPLTPPNERVLQEEMDQKKKLEKVVTKPKRKPRMKYRPENGTILNISSYDEDIPILDQDDLIDNEDVSFLHYALKYSRKITCVTGAGISVASGIPDFRSSNGLFQGLKSATSSGSTGKALFDSNVYRDYESTAKFHAMIRQLYELTNESEPTDFHKMLNDISKDGRLLRLYTQNIDCLETDLSDLQTTVPIKSNPPYPPTIQLHGTIKYMYCSKCRWNSTLQPELFEGNEAPACPECTELDEIRILSGKRSQGIGCLRPRIVLYNEFHPDGEHIGQVSTLDLKSKPDCLIIAGTSLKIPGVRKLVRELARSVHAARGCVIWVNVDEPTVSVVDFVEHIDLIVTGDCQNIPKIVDSYDQQINQPKSKKRVKKEVKQDQEQEFVKDETKQSPKIKQTKSIKSSPSTKTTKKQISKPKSKKDTKIQSRLEQLVTKINEAK
ncbi:NAD-dependent deacetylase hst4 [Wickerhamomyces ciferrii]|uniref:NAD-dependent deacetylase hst4 n=1 Tax=Wickerhamomyces ciferrii (strain ATCC 14091 / BCRC 22168 / CBS 111 / JCM 3599 / NBRC 0793 / NRRL Y-1031 F-60-10) TaxID=1206466 RepID=K0KHH8_WICCF|nr:NAD-dependent deacetylase hst4 [Wickerhamomyces ciferrii]CCH41632.1 NAD-dependent deacetylase hst4 [Wickerhamomyces ciferrii]